MLTKQQCFLLLAEWNYIAASAGNVYSDEHFTTFHVRKSIQAVVFVQNFNGHNEYIHRFFLCLVLLQFQPSVLFYDTIQALCTKV